MQKLESALDRESYYLITTEMTGRGLGQLAMGVEHLRSRALPPVERTAPVAAVALRPSRLIRAVNREGSIQEALAKQRILPMQLLREGAGNQAVYSYLLHAEELPERGAQAFALAWMAKWAVEFCESGTRERNWGGRSTFFKAKFEYKPPQGEDAAELVAHVQLAVEQEAL